MSPNLSRLVRLTLEAAVNLAAPVVIYTALSGRLGDVRALMAASAPPVLWTIAAFLRERRIDAISILALAGLTLSLLAFAGGGGIKLLQLRENLVTGLVGLVFLGSAAMGRPLILGLARAGARRRGHDLGALADHRRFRRAMTLATLAWGFGLSAACVLNCVLVFSISIRLFLVVGPCVSYGVIGLLTAWTFWYVPREKRLAEAQQAEAA